MVVAKSVDFGQSWSIVIADRGVTDADKPVLAVRGEDVYVGFNRDRKMLVASSHDGGITFASADVGPKLRLVRSLAGGATVDPHGYVYLAWAGYTRHDGAKGRENLYISKSSDGGESWATRLMDVSGAAPDCGAYRCEWGYLGAQITMASDEAGTLYALWNSGAVDKSLERIYFASSTTAGDTWSLPGGRPNGFATSGRPVAGSSGWVVASSRSVRSRLPTRTRPSCCAATCGDGNGRSGCSSMGWTPVPRTRHC